jgi:HEPN domain-containing protein
MGIDESSVNKAMTRMDDAKTRFEDISSDLRSESDEGSVNVDSPSTEVQKCQRAIELYAKSLLDFSGVQYPTKHQIPIEDDSIKNSIRAIRSEYGDEAAENAYRVFLIASLWGSIYPGTEYGIVGLSPDDGFETRDAEMAFNHADEVRLTTNGIIFLGFSDYNDD